MLVQSVMFGNMTVIVLQQSIMIEKRTNVPVVNVDLFGEVFSVQQVMFGMERIL